MSILSSLIENIQKEQEHKQSAKSKLVDFEKMIADEARSQGMLPRTYLEQLCQKSESFANSKLVKVLMGEQSVVDEGKVKDMVLDMEADAAEMSKEEFIKAHGSQKEPSQEPSLKHPMVKNTHWNRLLKRQEII